MKRHFQDASLMTTIAGARNMEEASDGRHRVTIPSSRWLTCVYPVEQSKGNGSVRQSEKTQFPPIATRSAVRLNQESDGGSLLQGRGRDSFP